MIENEFLKDVVEGLNETPKKLSSKYFYNEKGDRLFQKIMDQPEYYLTDSEVEILEEQSKTIAKHLKVSGTLRVLEPGAGDGRKALILMDAIQKVHKNSIFSPIDISPDVLDQLKNKFKQQSPKTVVNPIVCDYFNLKKHLQGSEEEKRLMLFMGSNIGNYTQNKAIEVLKMFTSCLRKGDYFMMATDLVKNPKEILAAYNDKSGATSAFNLNLLTRINDELDADFDLKGFRHYPIYNPIKNRAESYIMSTREQIVTLDGGRYEFNFKPWEVIHTEISRKYYPSEIHDFAHAVQCSVIHDFYNKNKGYMCSLWQIE